MEISQVLSTSLSDDKRFLVALVGRGPALDRLVRLMSTANFASAFPRVKLVGWVPAPGALTDEDDLEMPEALRHQPVFADVPALFAARPGIDLAIDLSPDARHAELLRACAPTSVSLGTADMVLRFCAATEDGRLAIAGGANLDKAERLFGLVMDQMEDDILVLNKDGLIVDANLHASASRGLLPGDLIGQPCNSVERDCGVCVSGDDAACAFQEARRGRAKAERTLARADDKGRVRYIHTVCFPVTNALGEVIQYLYLRRDVTEQEQLEQRLQQTEKMAAIGELSTYMAHEIRNPLFSIGGFANALLRNPSLNDLAREKARIIYDESRRLDVILTSILNFARPTEQDMGEFAAEDVARQTVELMAIGSEERGINVVIDIEPQLPKVRGNAENLKQCLINLVKNAMEAMHEGGVLTMTVRADEGFVRLQVADTGPGIAPDIQEKVFSPFFTTKHSGAGLGLAMTRKVIDDMGGRVHLDSRPDAGTRVTLMLPVALAVEGQPEAAQPVNYPPASDAAQPTPAEEAWSARRPNMPEERDSPGHAGARGRPASDAESAASRKGPDEDPYA